MALEKTLTKKKPKKNQTKQQIPPQTFQQYKETVLERPIN